MRIGLPTRLLLLIAATLIPTLAVGVVGLGVFEREATAVVEAGLLNTARALSLAVDGHVSASISALQVLARSPELGRGDLRGFADVAGLVRADEQWENVVLSDASGQQLVNPRVPWGTRLPAVADLETIRRVVATRRPAASNLFVGNLAQRPLLKVSVPVERGGTVRYVLSASLPLAALSELLARQKLPDDSIGSLGDRNHVIIARTRARETFVGQRFTPDLVAQLDARPEGSFVAFTKEGQRVHAAFSRSPLTGWAIAVGIPLEAMQQPLRHAHNLILGGGAVIIFAGVLIALQGSRGIAASIRSLRGIADDATSEATARLPAITIPEVREVGEALVAAHGRRKLAEVEIARRREVADGLAEVSRSLSQSLDPVQVAQTIVEAVKRLLGARMTAVYRVDPESGDLELLASVGYRGPWESRLPRGTATVGVAIRERRPITTIDALNDPRIQLDDAIRARIEQAGYRSVAAIPLMIQDEIVGVIVLGDDLGRTFAPDDVELLQRFADHAASVIRDARLFQDLREAYERLSQAQTQLIEAQKMEAVGRLAGGIAHDFSNLLTIILGRCELVASRPGVDEQTRADAEVILRTVERTTSVVQQLLAFGRRQVIAPRVVDINATIAMVLPMLQRLIGEDIVLKFEPGAPGAHVRIDPGQIDQVVVNLIVNARDAMPAGGRITIDTSVLVVTAGDRVHAELAPGAYVVVAVTDTGSGMSPDVLAHVFEPFFTTKRVGRGTGLGLAMVYGTLKQNGGHVGVTSEPDRGTTFRLYLPRVDAEAPAARATITPRAPRGNETVLLVEDEHELRQLARDVLTDLGYLVLDAGDPREGIALAERYPGTIDALVTDVVMPHLGGTEVAERILKSRPGTRVLYSSGYAESAAVRNSLGQPGVAFLPKPFTTAELARKLRELLDQAREDTTTGPA